MTVGGREWLEGAGTVVCSRTLARSGGLVCFFLLVLRIALAWLAGVLLQCWSSIISLEVGGGGIFVSGC